MRTVTEKMEESAKAYFNSLPAVLQEQIVQSGAEMTTKEQLERYCKNALDKPPESGSAH